MKILILALFNTIGLCVFCYLTMKIKSRVPLHEDSDTFAVQVVQE